MNYPSSLPTAGVLFGLTLQTFKNVSMIFKKKSQWMNFHQLFASFQIFLFQCLRIPEELFCHRINADQLPPV
jgi:hypothetical protein